MTAGRQNRSRLAHIARSPRPGGAAGRARASLAALLLALSGSCLMNGQENPCNEARAFLDGCGVSLPILADGACAGLRETIALCVLESAATCREAAEISTRTDGCAAGLDVLGAESVPPPPRSESSPSTASREDDDASCADARDNDGDGFTDCDDVGCAGSSDVSVCDVGLAERTDALCSDGVDNDGDGTVDCADEDCSTSALVTICAAGPTAGPTDGPTDGPMAPSLRDSDGDGIDDETDAVNLDGPSDDRDRDGVPNDLDPDDDGDGICDPGVAAGSGGCALADGRADLCPYVFTLSFNVSIDGDADGDECDLDRDGDGVRNALDRCPFVADPTQPDDDGDGFGNACDAAPGDAALQLSPAAAPIAACLQEAGEEICDLTIEEVLYNLTSAGGQVVPDANFDGSASTADDEYVELRNTSDRDLDIGGLEIHDTHTFDNFETVAPRHRVPEGTVLRRWQRLVVYGGGTPPTASPEPNAEALWQTASSGALALNNDGDAVILVSADLRVLSLLFVGPGGDVESGPNRSVARYPESARSVASWREHPALGAAPFHASPGRSPEDR